MKNVQELIEKYKRRLEDIINPDNQTWEDFGQDGPVEGFTDINDYIESNEDCDEGQQTEKRCIREFVEDLNELLHESTPLRNTRAPKIPKVVKKKGKKK
jgi:hypothetical protein